MENQEKPRIEEELSKDAEFEGMEPWEIEIEKEKRAREAEKEAFHKTRPKKRKKGEEKTTSSEYKKDKIEKAQWRKEREKNKPEE
jgi:hypothetical protein